MCSICYNDTKNEDLDDDYCVETKCCRQHPICVYCLQRLDNLKCPFCKRYLYAKPFTRAEPNEPRLPIVDEIEYEDDEYDQHLREIRERIQRINIDRVRVNTELMMIELLGNIYVRENRSHI